MDTRVIFLACLCLVSRVYGAAYGEACPNGNGDCTDDHQVCGTSGDMNGKCTCATNYAYDTSATACKVRQGGACTGNDASVCVQYTTCSSDLCTCKPGSKATGDLCVQVYDMTCADNDDCSALTHSQCAGDPKKCACAAGYKIGTDTPKTCSAVIGGACSAATDCSSLVEHSTCASDLCACTNGYTGVVCEQVYNKACTGDPNCDALKYGKCSAQKCKCDDSKAVVDGVLCYLKIDQVCTNTDICPPHSSCKDDDNTKKCKCADNYYKENDKCKEENAGMTIKASVLLLVAALATVFLR